MFIWGSARLGEQPIGGQEQQDLGERHGFRGAANKSAVTAPLNEHMKKAFRKWKFSHPKSEQNWSKKYCEIDKYVGKFFWDKKSA